MANDRLTDEEVLGLDSILVDGNEKIIGLHFEKGYYGVGGSNNSPYTEELNVTKKLEELAGQRPLKMFNAKICAVVNDVVYLVLPNGEGERVFSFDAKGYYSYDYGVAYDTVEGCYIGPVLRSE